MEAITLPPNSRDLCKSNPIIIIIPLGRMKPRLPTLLIQLQIQIKLVETETYGAVFFSIAKERSLKTGPVPTGQVSVLTERLVRVEERLHLDESI